MAFKMLGSVVKIYWQLQNLGFILFLSLLCHSPTPTLTTKFDEMAGDIEHTELHAQFARNLGQFSGRMYEQLVAEEEGNGNIIFSPFSIQTCVAMARLGADGETAVQLDRGLSLISGDVNAIATSFENVMSKYANSTVLKIANKIYASKGSVFRPEFNELVTKKFYSEAEEIDFSNSLSAAAEINGWVESKTNSRIKDLVPASAIDRYTRLVLLNAIHFKGEWEHAFKKERTSDDDFYLNESDTVKVPMMNQKARFRYADLPELEATALEMPYKDCDLSMLVILPNSRTGLKALEQKLKDVNLGDIVRKMHFAQVVVKFPKFKAEFSIELKEQFKKLGMDRMFSDKAEFNKMLESSDQLVVSKILHKAFIEVNEEGTEAAAATAAVVRKTRSIQLNQPELIADHPFYYAINHAVGSDHVTFFAGSIQKLLGGATDHDEL